MSDREAMEERLGETLQEHRYADDPPVICEDCGAICVQVEAGFGDDFNWVCPDECRYEKDPS